MTEQQIRQNVVDTFKSFLGAKRGDARHKKIVDAYNAHKPLPQGYKVSYTDPWCATTVSAVAIMCGLSDIIPQECSCSRQIALLKKIGAWQESDKYIPKIGDLVYYDWDDGANYATTDDAGAPEHVGMVCAVTSTGFTVIEGNKGSTSEVGYRSVKLNGRYIRGFGTPNYASKADKPITTASEAVDKLYKLGVINSPDYWKVTVKDGKVQYLDKLLINAANRIVKCSLRTGTVSKGVEALVKANVITTPEYWLRTAETNSNVGELLKALGGAAAVS